MECADRVAKISPLLTLASGSSLEVAQCDGEQELKSPLTLTDFSAHSEVAGNMEIN